MYNFDIPPLFSNFAANFETRETPVENKSKNVSKKQQESAKIAFEHMYSAYELGDLMNNNPLALLDLDLGYQTRWYDIDFIEEIMSFIGKEEDMLMFTNLVVNSWREQSVKHHPRVAYRDPKTKQTIPYVTEIDIKLQEIHDRIMGDREQISQVSAFREMFFKQYSAPSTHIEEETQKPRIDLSKTTTSVNHSNNTEHYPRILLEDLPENVRSKVLIDQEVFDVFVKQLNEDTWSIVDANKGVLCDALRFVCIKREIVARDTDRETFDTLLHIIVKALKNQPSLVSSMKRRTDTSSNKIKRSLICYNSPVKRHQDEVWQLNKDCKPIENSLLPVYEAMEYANLEAL